MIMVKFFSFILILFLLIASVYSQEGYKDPFEPVLPEEREETEEVDGVSEETRVLPPEVVVEGVLWGTGSPQAIINSEVYKVGDAIKDLGAKVLKIEQNIVFITYGGKIYRLEIKKGGGT